MNSGDKKIRQTNINSILSLIKDYFSKTKKACFGEGAAGCWIATTTAKKTFGFKHF